MGRPQSSLSSSSTVSTSSGNDCNGSNKQSRLLRGGAPLLVSKLPEHTPHTPLLLPDATADSPPLASDAKTFGSAIIAFLGSGVLGFPYAFKQTGITLGVALLLLVGSLTAFCMLLIVECKYQILKQNGLKVTTYGDIGAIVMGKPGQWIVNLSLVVSQAGFAVAYLIFISANANAYFGISKQLVVMLCVPPLVLFCLIRHLKQLSYVALVADIMNFTGLAVVFAADFSFMDFSASSPQLASLHVLGSLSSIPFFFGVATYSFAGIGMALPLENAMANKRHFKRILLRTITLIATLYGTFGICGYVAFGDATQDVVTLNIDGHGSLSTIVKLCLCAGLLCACPLMLFPVFEALQPACLAPFRLADRSSRTEQSVIILFRSLVVLIVATIAGAAPNFGIFISFIGSTCCACLGYVLPVVFHLELFRETHTPLSKWALRGVIVVGLLAVAAGFYSAGRNLF